MKRTLLATTLTFTVLAPLAVFGADAPENPNRFGLGPRFGFNFKATFNNNGAFNSPGIAPGAAGGGLAHIYNDGFVLVDSSGNLGGLTTFWGYENPSQVVGGGMEFHSVAASGPSSATDNPQFGAELVYQRVFSLLPDCVSGRWGLEVGLGYTALDLENKDRGNVNVTTDTYPLSGVLPPAPPYNGTFLGPGALLGDTPSRTTTFAAQSGKHRLSGDMFSLRLGPFIEVDLTPKLSLASSIGLTLAPTSLNYDFSETDTLTTGVGFTMTDKSSESSLLYGPYLSAILRYDFNESWGIHAGAQFQSLNSMEQSVAGRSSRFDPGATVYATVGITWRF